MIFNPKIHLGTSWGATPAKSLVLAAASSQYLTRTWGTSPTDNKKATFSFFIKRTTVQSDFANIYDGGIWNGGSSESSIRLGLSDFLQQTIWDGASTLMAEDYDAALINDSGVWHHVLIAIDNTLSSNNVNTGLIYIDGSQIGGSGNHISTQNASLHLTDNGLQSAIGKSLGANGRYLNAQLAYFYFIDGQVLTPSSFTTGTGAGTTHPAAYGGSFGTNGFYLNFTGDSLNDQSGNSNNWSPNGSPTFSSDIPT